MFYWMKHTSIGRTTHASGTAGAYIRYITRPSACSDIMANGVPINRWQARHWINQQEMKSRKNGRVCDRIMLALPRELHPLQRKAMVRQFLDELTQSKVPWYAVIHDRGKDANNPHCHILIRDNCPKTGKKVLGLSSKASTHRLQALWRDVNLNWLPKYQKTISRHSEAFYALENEFQLGA